MQLDGNILKEFEAFLSKKAVEYSGKPDKNHQQYSPLAVGAPSGVNPASQSDTAEAGTMTPAAPPITQPGKPLKLNNPGQKML